MLDIDTLRALQIDARKDRDLHKRSVYTLLMSDVLAIGKKSGREPNDEEITSQIKTTLKKINELLAVVPDDAKALREKEILEELIPIQMSETALIGLVTEQIEMLDEPSMSDMGQIMKFFKEHYNGYYDGKLLSNVVRRLLS